ncbi:MAG: acetylxylan esterase [Bacteroidaceae bacterium]|nr:acetylxylan esterase [Bacteroidaceae bacterium]
MLKKSFKGAIALSLMIVPLSAFAQWGGMGMNMNRDSLNKVAEADYANMMEQLGIKEMKPGRNPNTQDVTQHPNYDELIANPYYIYPELLVTNSGKQVKNAKMWNKVRRPELVRTFEEELYGCIPENVPDVDWQIVSEEKAKLGDIDVVLRTLTGVVDNSSYPEISVNIQANVIYPDNGAQNMPVVVEFGYGGGMPRAFGNSKPWQQMVVERGWAAATIVPGSIQADAGYGLTSGIIGLCNKGEFRKPTDWGSLRAWGWGVSRLIDYFETDKQFDATKVAIEGVSRYGKAALVAMAFDERIAAGFICSSGKAGAAGWRRDLGEITGNITSPGEYHWMAGNFMKYGAVGMTDNDIPVDQHQLIALCAPRACFISGGRHDADKWQDIVGMFMAAAKASPAWEILGAEGLPTDVLPLMNEGLLDGDLVYRQHDGGHEAGPNWPYFLDFFARTVVNSK